MIHYKSYIKSTATILNLYKGDEPFANFLKKYFGANKKFGSKDRKYITALCYNFFRLGKAYTDMPIEEKIFLSTFLIGNYEKDFLLLLKDDWLSLAKKTLQEKLTHLQIDVKLIFPFVDELSEGIEHTTLCQSYFMQPKLFLRFREQFLRWQMLERLNASKIPYKWEDLECLSFENGTKVEEVLKVGEEVIVQDYSSQQTLNYIKENREFFKSPNIDVWDCCAASGGKSILYYDIMKLKSQITVSDVRLSILNNLHQRFKKAGIAQYNYFVCDLEKNKSPLPQIQYSTIICDAPCSGSGTWGRTPEQLYFFEPKKIKHYTALQQKIITNAMPQLKDGGHFFYITCSVFKAENEEQVKFIEKKCKLKLIQMNVLKGYDKQADSMFVAVFKKK
ncbi:MAG: Fmu (Sun) domain-containing protein [Ferruginibacter sp.]|nr:Fmu (Sun) domain-containing protein [Ferruginibacter sp.]